MIDGETHQREKSAATDNDVADFAELQASWARVWESQKAQVGKAKTLAVQELKLSVKGLVLSFVCILLLVGISLITWTGLLFTLGYSAYSYGVHWMVVAVFLITLNLLLFWVIHRVFKNAVCSIGLSTTLNTLFGKPTENSSTQT
ncbi:hypothetical protein Q4574_05485 [Aliiglaciecola sp. 3_MG-2023]|uniref:hypothetical protein n=1 Tax=Aliiglaciecola sp. 3_MG-2023 TaxID=3062644 RepID=UPI0026E439AC|nr:hypothetical protein [Aliiglaciecola sp. 3_MG-2023]MDO6692724.1 hypothetical protein [Aliiglaciecola sp. 3_MG-2023]